MGSNTGFGGLGSSKLLNGAKVTFSPGKTSEMDVSIVKTLTDLGATVKVLSVEGRTLEEQWFCRARSLNRETSGGPYCIVDQSGELIQLLFEGVKAEQVFASTGTVPDPACTNDVSVKAMLGVIGEGLNSDPFRFHKIKDGIVGATVDTSIGATALRQMEQCGTLTFPAIIVPPNQSANRLTEACLSLLDDQSGPMNLHVPALLDLWKERSSGKYENKVYDFPENLDQNVASLHLERLVENQAEHICVQVEGDHQPANNRIGAVQCLKVCGAMIPFLSLLVAVAKWISGDFD